MISMFDVGANQQQKFELDFYFEVVCPFCKRVRLNIIDKLKAKGIININEIDVDANLGCVEMSWFKGFSKDVGYDPTPVLRMHDKPAGQHSNWAFVFLLWKKKPTTITEQVLTEEGRLEKDIYDKIRQMQNTQVIEVQESWELDEEFSLNNWKRGLYGRIH